MAERSLSTHGAVSGEYQLSERDRRSLLTEPQPSIPPNKLRIVEQQRRRFIEHFGWDGLSGSDPAEATEFCSKTFREREIP